jgi:hypothetical protein
LITPFFEYSADPCSPNGRDETGDWGTCPG